jgi:hypothetical protein
MPTDCNPTSHLQFPREVYQTNEGCPAPVGKARLEPPVGLQMLGFHINWQLMDAVQLRSLLGYTPAVINAFLQLDSTQPFRFDLFEWHAQEAQSVGAFLQITLEPSKSPSEFDTMPQAILDEIAQECLRVNTKYGTPIYLRYGHEMNGNRKLNPQVIGRITASSLPSSSLVLTFDQGFRRMAEAVRAVTNLTAMVWAPNLGVNYPFSGGNSPLPTAGTPNFLLLDTNSDGVIDLKDDPYTRTFL